MKNRTFGASIEGHFFRIGGGTRYVRKPFCLSSGNVSIISQWRVCVADANPMWLTDGCTEAGEETLPMSLSWTQITNNTAYCTLIWY